MGRREASTRDSVRARSSPTSPPRRFRGGLVSKAHRLLYHSALGMRKIPKKRKHKGILIREGSPLLLKLTEVLLLLRDFPLSTFVSVGSAFQGTRQNRESCRQKSIFPGGSLFQKSICVSTDAAKTDFLFQLSRVVHRIETF